MYRVFDSVAPAASLSVRPGAVLGGRYRLAELIGRGRTAFVHRANDLAAPRRSVAVKVLRRALCDQPDEVAGLLVEGNRMRAFAHPCIARVHDAGLEDGVPFLVMDEIPGGSMRAITERGVPVSAERAADLLEGAARALCFLHTVGWVHADIKPGNLLLDEAGQSKLVDFDCARRIGARPGTPSDRIVTPSYAAPEVIAGASPEPQDDVFALAIVAYELIAGCHPFDYRPARPTDVVWPPPGLSRRARVALAAALSTRRADRPADPLALVRELRAPNPLARLLGRLAPCPA